MKSISIVDKTVKVITKGRKSARVKGRLARTENRLRTMIVTPRCYAATEIKEEVLNVYEAIGCKRISNLSTVNGPNGITILI